MLQQDRISKTLCSLKEARHTRNTYTVFIIPFICKPIKGKSTEAENRLPGKRDEDGGDCERTRGIF